MWHYRLPQRLLSSVSKSTLSSGTRLQISTLSAERLRPSDWLELSGLRHPDIPIDTTPEHDTVKLTYRQERTTSSSQRVPFPDRTRGFLYLHVPDAAHIAGAEIRFRLAPDGLRDPKDTMASGTDLHLPEGIPWRILAPAACCRKTYAGLAALLRQDGIVPPQAIEHWASPTSRLPAPWAPVLHTLDQSFLHDFDGAGSGRVSVYVADGFDLVHAVVTSYRMQTTKDQIPEKRLSGRAQLRIEAGQSASGASVFHLRVLKNLGADASVVREGELLSMEGGRPVEVSLCENTRALVTLARRGPGGRHIGLLGPGHKGAQTRRLRRWVSNLDPKAIREDDFVDLSGSRMARTHILGALQHLTYRLPAAIPFPPGTHGFLYRDPHQEPSAARYARLKFRITKNASPASFFAGHDLRRPDGKVWSAIHRPPSSGGPRSSTTVKASPESIPLA